MRKLIVTRGHPGSGKSHALKEAGLRDWTLSSDELRNVFSAPILTSEGKMTINPSPYINQRVFPLMAKLAEERMHRGETLAIDTTLIERSDLEDWAEMARRFRYQIAVLDMTPTSLDDAIANNFQREESRVVPEAKIREMHARLVEAGLRPVEGVHVISGRDDGGHIEDLIEWVKEPVRDFNHYTGGVVHIGDLQGCHTVVTGPGGPLENGFKDDTAYIFIGDLLDRGIENGKVMRWFVDEALDRDNVYLLWGNHEDHLHLWATGQEAVSNEFQLRTLPQLEEAGVTPADADAVCNKALDYMEYTYRGALVLATHAGLSTYPDNPHLISLEQFSKGTGHYSDPVDEQFERNSKRGFQVHGHRNYGHVGIEATEHSFNLEDSVEFGGHLRTCTLDKYGWHVNAYRNHVFKPMKERMSSETVLSEHRKQERKLVPHWILRDDGKSTRMDEETLKSMQEHSGVRQKASDRFPHVFSLNFTKKVFYDRSWDDVVVKARGLFISDVDSEVVARGYNKFFNVGERVETQVETLAKTMQFPITLYVKYNGYLGNIGYDRTTDSIFVASKSTPDGDFAEWFREILDAELNDTQKEQLRRYLRDTESSMTFEVIDPVRDPHMIAYDRPKLVLLDILRRSTEFEKADFAVVEAVGRKIGLETKQKAMTFQNAVSFAGWYKKAVNDMNYKVGGEHVEGLVIEDAVGYMTKVKLPFYAFWKQMRSMKDRIVSTSEKGQDFAYEYTRKSDGSAPSAQDVALANDFRDWCLQQPVEDLKADIIALRDKFEADMAAGYEVSSSIRM